ncbi:hypothetical protein LINPERPRIM_LOCUS33479, partial [Linum perenne]
SDRSKFTIEMHYDEKKEHDEWSCRDGSDKEVCDMSADVVKDCNFVRVFLIKKEESRQALDYANSVTVNSSLPISSSSISKKAKEVEQSSNDNPLGDESDDSVSSGFQEEGDEFSDEDVHCYSDHENYINISVNKHVQGEEEERQTENVTREDGELDRAYVKPGVEAEELTKGKKKRREEVELINKRPLKFRHSDPTRLEVVCQTGGPWRNWASKRQDGRVQTKTTKLKHSGCVLKYQNKFGDDNYIAKKYMQQFAVDPDWNVKSLIQTIQEDLHMNILVSKAWRIRRKAKEMVCGLEADQYGRLYDYCDEVRRSNVGSTIFVEPNDNGVIRRMYCCLGACKEGFLDGCRKVIGVDGCFLKTEYEGQLLSIVGLDANNEIFPIAYAVVRVENEDNWTWFLQTLSHDLDITSTSGNWMFMSDKQKGIKHGSKVDE